MLRGKAEELGADVRFSTVLTSFQQDEEGVTAVLRDRRDGAERAVRADWLIAADGAGNLAELAQAELIDQYMLFVSPAAIGAGKPLFAGVQRELPLTLLETRVFDSAFVLLRYARGHRA